MKVCLTGPKGDPHLEAPADSIRQQLQQVKTAICALQEDCANLSALRSQMIVSLQEYQYDSNLLCHLTEMMRTKNGFHIASEIPVVYGVMPQQIPETVIANTAPSISHHCDIQSQTINWHSETTSTDFSPTLRYSLSTGEILCIIQFDPTGQYFAFADGKTVFFRNTTDGSEAFNIPLPPVVGILDPGEIHTRVLAFSPNGKFLFVGHQHQIVVIDMAIKQKSIILEKHKQMVSAFAFNKDCSQLVSAGFDGLVVFWNIQYLSNEPLQVLLNDSREFISSICFAPDYSFLAIGFMNGSIGICDPSGEQMVNIFKAHEMTLMHLAVSSDFIVASASHDKTIKLWTLKGIAKCQQTLIGHENIVITCTFSPDGKYLFSGGKDEQIMSWDVATGKRLCVSSAHKNTVFEISHHPTEKSFVSCCGEGIICLWYY